MGRATPLIPPPRTEIGLGDGRVVRIGAQLGRGALSTVYRGTVRGPFGLARPVAVKVFDIMATDEHDGVLGALASAATRQACVSHPNVVRVEEFGVLGPAQPYAVLELVEGRTLASFCGRLARARERVPLDIALFVGCEVAEALAAARLACTVDGVRLGLVHGELSADDVLLSWHGEVKVGDFAIAAAARGCSTVRSVRSIARRVRAMAPEVACGRAGDARSDVFSLGVLLREMLQGPRFPAYVTDGEALAWARDGVVHRSMFEPQLPQELQAVIARALERDPTRRHPHAGALGFELRRIALAMGVGDGRAFLRTALARTVGSSDDDEVTGELSLHAPGSGMAAGASVGVGAGVRARVQSGEVDRFARLRGDDEGSDSQPRLVHESGKVPVASMADDEDDCEEA
jgi:serine/threonine-protein kinase